MLILSTAKGENTLIYFTPRTDSLNTGYPGTQRRQKPFFFLIFLTQSSAQSSNRTGAHGVLSRVHSCFSSPLRAEALRSSLISRYEEGFDRCSHAQALRRVNKIYEYITLAIHFVYVSNLRDILVRAKHPRGGGRLLPYISYTGMCRPTGS